MVNQIKEAARRGEGPEFISACTALVRLHFRSQKSLQEPTLLRQLTPVRSDWRMPDEKVEGRASILFDAAERFLAKDKAEQISFVFETGTEWSVAVEQAIERELANAG